MAQAKRKNTTAITTDAELFKLHDKFCAAYNKMEERNTPAVQREDKPAHRKWERAADEAFARANAVIAAPAHTLEGMLMKLHVAGFAITHAKPGTWSDPDYKAAQLWEPGNFASDDVSIIVSLRDDLHRLMGRRA
jgi:hypothetical protein